MPLSFWRRPADRRLRRRWAPINIGEACEALAAALPAVRVMDCEHVMLFDTRCTMLFQILLTRLTADFGGAASRRAALCRAL